MFLLHPLLSLLPSDLRGGTEMRPLETARGPGGGPTPLTPHLPPLLQELWVIFVLDASFGFFLSYWFLPPA